MGKRIKIPVITTKEDERIRRKAVDRGTAVYFAHLPEGVPDSAAFESAARLAESAATGALLPALLDAVSDEPPASDRRSLLLLRMEERLHPLALPEPELAAEIPPIRVAAAAAFGSIAGMLFLPAFTWILLDSRAAGVFIGAPLGAMLGSTLALLLPRNRRLLGGLAALLGLAGAREALRFLGGGALFSKGWSLLRGKRLSLKSLLLLPLVLVLLLLLGKRDIRFDRKKHEEAVRRELDSWTEGAARIALLAAATSSAVQQEAQGASLAHLAARILSLAALSSPDTMHRGEGALSGDLTAGIAELAVEVRNLGFSEERVPLPNRPEESFRNATSEGDLRWSDEIAERYAPFGAIENGDDVRIEREPLFRNGELVAKGLVRKVRG